MESTVNSEEKIKNVTEKMDDSEQDVQFEVSIPDDQFDLCLINEQIKNNTVGTSYMFARKEVAAAEPQKTSADDVQGRDAM